VVQGGRSPCGKLWSGMVCTDLSCGGKNGMVDADVAPGHMPGLVGG
jgi:hypothetical protein